MAAYAVAAGQAVLVAALAPWLLGWMRAVRARLEGRAGGRFGQPWRDLRKQLRKEPITPADAGVFFVAAPPVLMATSLLIAGAAPYVSTRGPLSGVADLVVVVGLLLLGTVALALAGLDTGTAFGGMGASREMTIAALVEPTLLLAVFALSTRVGSTDLAAIVAAGAADPARVISPVGALAAAALAVAVLAESGRLPVDNPSTHLELTMVHEAMVLEYAGRDLALVEWAAAMRLSILLGLLATLFLPWGVATSLHPAALAGATALFAVKVFALGGLLAAGEVFLAKVRLFRVPELLAGSFVLGLLAVLTASVLA
ncbi:NADH-quinone oxidoreductase subunit H [Phytohabitans sp. ZYX-F-186]|uniref:NADH-quinone oxidoreductase subunit H n=1 Tax=Phytohabitans maris TaxID=3071409 RepID=A0ABU0ZDK5_9ACTN|nr:NADH-quinone oxidoreductase subunit H [Phytohabitans sp. ZYX-F-186]MDQ7904027.1 NADH-quinone oxidoreductase subunit H [Phytohabitans sp. ZYX-F-186]